MDTCTRQIADSLSEAQKRTLGLMVDDGKPTMGPFATMSALAKKGLLREGKVDFGIPNGRPSFGLTYTLTPFGRQVAKRLMEGA